MPARAHTALFFLAMLGLCSWHLDGMRNDNTVSRAAMVAAIVGEHRLCIDSYHRLTNDKALVAGHYFSEKAPLPALLVVPFLYAADTLHLITPGEHGLLTDGLLRLGGFLCGSVPLAIIITMLWWRLRQRPTALSPVVLASLPFFGSFLFVYSGSFHGHLLAALFILIAWRQRLAGATLRTGVFAAAAVLCEYSLFVFPLAWLVQDATQRNWTAARNAIIGGVPGVVVLLLMNSSITGSALVLPYSSVAGQVDAGRTFGLAYPTLEALIGLLISNYRGLFAFAPVTILCLFAWFLLHDGRGLRGLLLHALFLPCIALVLMIASHSMWWGGWAFGPRHLTSVAVLVLFGGIMKLPARGWVKWPFTLLAGWGLIIAFAAKNTAWYGMPTGEQHPLHGVIMPAVRGARWTDLQWPVAVGLSPAMGVFLFVLTFVLAMRLLKRADASARPAIS